MCTSCGHKVTPTLNPEDYQALINQGVKPEDIILNLNDDTDAESDISINDSGCNNLSSEFVFPAEVTTSKLLAVNTAAKNLKRQHPTTEGGLAAAAAVAAATTTTTSNVNNTKLSQNNETELTEFHDLNEASTSSSAFIATAGYSTRLFYGSSNITKTTTTNTLPHKSVIVSPQSQLKRVLNGENPQLLPASNVQNGDNEHASVGCNNNNNNNNNPAEPSAVSISSSGSCANASSAPLLEDHNNLQAISSHETKKARRVQKTTRCFNNSGNKRK